MATSLYIGSDETFQHVCDICLEDDRHVEAVALCSVCDQYLCVTCKTVHERSKASKSHVLITGDTLDTKTVATKISCDVHGPNEEVKFFCLIHDVPCCEKCKLIDHRGCKRIESLTSMISKINIRDEGQTLLQNWTKLAKEVEYLKSAFENELSELAEQQDLMIETLHERRLKLDGVLDKWEAGSVKMVKDKFEKESRVLHENVSICSGVAPEVRANVAKMQQALKKSDEVSFIVIKETQKNNSKYNDTFLEMHKVSHTIEMYLEKDNITETFMTQLNDTIKIGISYSKNKNALPSFSTRPYKDRVALDAGEINVALAGDVGNPLISGIEVMHDQGNNILFCDVDNSKLKLLDISNGSLTETLCSSEPWRMCKTDVTNEIIVSQPDENCLQLFNVEKKKITTCEKIKTKRIIDINKYGNCFITQYKSETNKCMVFDVIDKNGKRIRNIRSGSSKVAFTNVAYQTIDSETIYVTDKMYGCIGLSMAGDVVFRYNNKLVKNCTGVTTDPEGNIYISGEESNNGVMVTSKGETIKVLLDGIEKPRFIKYDEPTNTLFVVQKDSPIVKMFHLM